MSISQSEIEIIASKAFELGVRYALVGRDSGDTEANALAGAAAIVRDELVKAGVPVQRKRRAIVKGNQGRKSLRLVRSYLPTNYEATFITAIDGNGNEATSYTSGSFDGIVIEGYDRAGWTLDAYVIPRLASGLIVAKEDE